MKVLQAIAGAPQGGAERFFERLVPALSRAGLEQRVLIRKDARRAALLAEAGIADLHQLAFGGTLDFRTRRAFRRHVRDFRPDIVFTWMSRASLMAPASPLLGHVFRKAARLGGYYDLKYYQGFDHLVGDTEDIVAYLVKEGWPAARASYLPNFVSGARGRPIPRENFAVPPGAPLLLGLGRLHENKAFEILLDALALVPGAYLLLAGAGPEQRALETRAAGLGVGERVRFLGWRDDTPDLFASVDLFVHPARHEPLGNVILESWAQGVPLVCTAASGPAALVEDGASGLLVPIDDAPALAAAIGRALGDDGLRAQLAEGGIRAWRRDYTEEAVVARYLAFFGRIAG